MRRGFSIAATVLLLSLSLAQEYTLKLNVKEGDTFRYKATMELEFSGQPVLVTFTTTDRVLKVEQDGTVQMEWAASEAMIKFGDQEITQPASPPIKINLKPNGALAKIEGETESPVMFRSGWTVFPEKPIRVGDRWSNTLKVGESEIRYEYEFVGVEKVNDMEALRIKVAASSPDTEFNSNGLVLVDAKSGIPLKMEIQFKSMQVSPSYPPLDGTLKMELVKGNGSLAPQGKDNSSTP
ncbi:MAG: hypothetical protein RMJ83_06965 [Armatimonadota bacterium]|nr:hypothetical protein [Armatimonadota bacterium]